ncbi:hypothetical protein ASG92_07280 [Arthrobacter sp. Soil736]|uniref:hypothetical protein n=1 Tax=Arthrobacter sp. Soil736 TaxID=1736395 RepID=UPI0006FD99C8|nr:hypothetical protein [Arthrobacter sp. Soil736]KRE53324.1 hypothetical protein ASG92_07280 [Arthrobacter sp. Soil736]
MLSLNPGLEDRPPTAGTRLPAARWTELAPGEAVWVESAGSGFVAGHVDEVSTHQEMLWVDFSVRGRRLLCGGDPVQVWTRD